MNILKPKSQIFFSAVDEDQTEQQKKETEYWINIQAARNRTQIQC